jgi:putative oxidoreductase
MSLTPLRQEGLLSQRVKRWLRTAVPLLLRGSLGITFVWFGGLKLAGEPTLPASLIAAITTFMDPDLSVPLVGAFEVALGAGLLIGRWMSVFLGAAALQLSGTFLVLLLRPDVAFVDGNPLRLSVEGEYVVKNLVLLAATASLALHTLGPQPPEAKSLRLAKARDSDRKRPTESAARAPDLRDACLSERRASCWGSRRSHSGRYSSRRVTRQSPQWKSPAGRASEHHVGTMNWLERVRGL